MADRSWAGTRKAEGIRVAVELDRIQEEADLVRNSVVAEVAVHTPAVPAHTVEEILAVLA